MRRLFAGMVAAVLAGGVSVSGQELVFDFTADEAIYMAACLAPNVFPDPEFLPAIILLSGRPYFSQLKKDTSAFDVFSLEGKIGSFGIPPAMKKDICSPIILSQKFIDNDDGWEALYSTGLTCRAVDDNGSILWSCTDSIFANPPFLGFDGKNTYVYARNQSGWSGAFKAWRFRTNISSSITPHRTLAKSAASGPLPMMTFGATGEYRVSLQQAGGGKTSMQLFDMLGRTIFTKTIDDITQPVSFTVPENSVPSTPFVAKFRDANGTTLRKQVPVR